MTVIDNLSPSLSAVETIIKDIIKYLHDVHVNSAAVKLGWQEGDENEEKSTKTEGKQGDQMGL
jgi:hypothetical protein